MGGTANSDSPARSELRSLRGDAREEITLLLASPRHERHRQFLEQMLDTFDFTGYMALAAGHMAKSSSRHTAKWTDLAGFINQHLKYVKKLQLDCTEAP